MTGDKEKIPYDKRLSLNANVARLRKHLGITNADIGKLAGLSGQSASIYIRQNLMTLSGKQTANTKSLRAVIDRMFDGGIPDDLCKECAPVDLFTLFGCSTCTYRMRSQAGCAKFSLTKAEINSGAYIQTRAGGSYHLSPQSRCPYATR